MLVCSTSFYSLQFKMACLFKCVILLACVVNFGSADTDEYNQYNPEMQAKLYNDLLGNYHSGVPPAHDGPVDVRMGFSLSYFDFIDEPAQLATVHGWAYRVWNDSRLQWDPKQYNGTSKMVMERSHVWVPEIDLQNSAKVTETWNSIVRVDYTGRLRINLSYQIDLVCHMNLKYFPYDEQICQLRFSPLDYSSETINLTASEYQRSYYMKTPNDFEITNFTMERDAMRFSFTPYEYVDVAYTIFLKRNSSAYTTKLVLPSILTGFLVLATFLLPTASHEKITLCGVLFLCLILLMTYLHLIVPNTGNTILGAYLAFALFVDFFATILAVVSYNVNIVVPAAKQSDIMLVDRTEQSEGEPKPYVPQSRNLQWLRYLDVCCFVLFSIIFIIGLAIILARRG